MRDVPAGVGFCARTVGMGIPSQVARLILREHRFRPITGRLLSIGKQIVHLTPEQAISLVETELGTRLDIDPLGVEADTSTRSSQGRNLISDRAFFSLFSDARYIASIKATAKAPTLSSIFAFYDFNTGVIALRKTAAVETFLIS